MKATQSVSANTKEQPLPSYKPLVKVDQPLSKPMVSMEDTKEHLLKISGLPRDVGWMLLISGLLSEVAPLIPPFWIFGILILWPNVGAQAGHLLHRKTPRLFKATVGMVNRYADDLEKRYPRKSDK